MPWVRSITRASGQIRAITPWQMPTKSSCEAVVGQEGDERRRQVLSSRPAAASASATSAWTSPSMSCRSASTSGSWPCSRSVALVTGPMLASRVPGRRSVADRVEEEAHGRGGGEGHVVGGGHGGALLVAERLGDRLVERHARRPRRRARAARRAARRGPRRRGPPAPARPARRPAPPPAPRRRTAPARRRRSCRARAAPPPCRGRSPPPASPASARASRPAAARRSNRSRDPVGAGQADEVVAPRSGAGPVERRRSGSPAPRRPRAPSARSRAASPLAWARARVTATVSPASGRASNQASFSRSAATGPNTAIAGAWIPASRGHGGDRGQRAGDHPLVGQRAALRSRPPARIAAGRRRSAARRSPPAGARPCRRPASRETRPAPPSRAPTRACPGPRGR